MPDDLYGPGPSRILNGEEVDAGSEIPCRVFNLGCIITQVEKFAAIEVVQGHGVQETLPAVD